MVKCGVRYSRYCGEVFSCFCRVKIPLHFVKLFIILFFIAGYIMRV